MSWRNPFGLGRRLAREADEAEKQRRSAHTEHAVAVEKLRVAERQAEVLKGMDNRNHYSESLTRAFQGKGMTA